MTTWKTTPDMESTGWGVCTWECDKMSDLQSSGGVVVLKIFPCGTFLRWEEFEPWMFMWMTASPAIVSLWQESQEIQALGVVSQSDTKEFLWDRIQKRMYISWVTWLALICRMRDIRASKCRDVHLLCRNHWKLMLWVQVQTIFEYKTCSSFFFPFFLYLSFYLSFFLTVCVCVCAKMHLISIIK